MLHGCVKSKCACVSVRVLGAGREGVCVCVHVFESGVPLVRLGVQ